MRKPVRNRVGSFAMVAVLSTLISCSGIDDGPDTARVIPGPGVPPGSPPVGSYVVRNDSSGLDSAKVAGILAVVAIKGAGFVPGHGRSDVRRLIIGPCNGSVLCKAGPLVRITPHQDSNTGDSATLAAGKLVAKLESVPGAPNQVEYRKFAIAAGGTAYEWIEKATVDSVQIMRSVFVPANPAHWRMAKWRETKIYHAASGPFARARFLWNDLDDEKWGTCMGGGCCAPPRFDAMDI